MIVVVDTNVAIVANGHKSEQASPDCIRACAVRLARLIQEDQLLIDDKWLIIKEYINNLSKSELPIGNAFLKWVLDNRFTGRIEQVSITPTVEHKPSFKEFPQDAQLENFDVSDRKFVAVSLAHPESPPILNAVDTDWWQFKDVLEANGVIVEFLCPNDVQRLLSASS